MGQGTEETCWAACYDQVGLSCNQTRKMRDWVLCKANC